MEHIEKRMVSESDRKTMYNGANWFYWLAALSAINSLIVFFVGTANLPISFGVTQWFDGTTGPLSATPLQISNLIMDLVIAAAFAGFGYLARRSDVAFVIGIVLYAMDALMSLGQKDFYAFAFHFVGFFFLLRGLLASRHLRENATTI